MTAPQTALPPNIETVSVAMCTFNGARYLSQQLDSILHQTSLPDEMVVCDDGSEDDTLPMLSAFAERAPFPVHVHCNRERLRFAANFAKCIGLCTGDLIVLTDQDDEWMPNRIADTRAAFAANPALTFTFSDAPLIGDQGQALAGTIFSQMHYPAADQQRLTEGSEMFPFLIRWAGLLGCTLALRSRYRHLFLPLPEGWPHDTWLTIVLSSLGPSRRLSPVTRYRQHTQQYVGAEDGSISGRVMKVKGRNLQSYQQAVEHTKLALAATRPHPELAKLTAVLQDRIQFGQARLAIQSGGLRQLPRLLQLFRTGEYQKQVAGLRSALKDVALLAGILR